MPKYIYGMDPASKMDYFGIVVHELPDMSRNQLPQLVTTRNYTHIAYTDMLDFLKEDLFRKFPPYYMVVDYSTEKTFWQIIEKQYGKERIELLTFGLQTKQMLKDDGLAILKQGYKFPNPELQKDPMQKENLKKLLQQLRQEQMLVRPSGAVSYDHPQGEHNDLVIAWECSIHGCLKFIVNATSGPVAAASLGKKQSIWSEDSVDPSDEIKLNPYNRITNENVWYPS